MRRLVVFIVSLTVALSAVAGGAEEARVLKVFPQYVDKRGQHTLSPSLFARDAYQAQLRMRPKERGGIRVAVQWKARDVDWTKLRLRVDVRGLQGNTLRQETLEKPAVKNGWLSDWTEVRLTGTNYGGFGDLVAWRASLWEGDKELASQQSFLWDGVLPKAK